MSKEIDERVVSMQFDNQHFEKNVNTSMSTLDKLKQKLHLKGASKGLEDVNAAAKKTDMGPLANGIETVRTKFSAMQVMGVTALANITNSAINAGKNIVSALTIDPVKAGFNEYELKIDSVRTIMASTGESVETVNKYLNDLNKYSDDTIYSFADMTQNIGKFTNAGVKLDDAVLAIKGISNAAALSGANANEASRSMYNFAQALSVGYVQRIDWKSIELANMATVEFKDQLLNAAIAAGTVKKNADGMYTTLAHPDKAYNAAAMFTETLDDQWLTTEVLVSTLKDYADTNTDIGKRATQAATEVTKLSQVFDIAKETAQSGWAKTWEVIFGDITQAKKLLTPISEAINGVLDSMSDSRNGILEGALSTPWDSFIDKLDEAGISVEDFESKLKKVAKGHGIDLDAIIKEAGSLKDAFAEGKISTDLITEAIKSFVGDGEEAAKATDKITESLKNTNKYVVKTGDCLYRIGKKYGMTWQELYALNKDIIEDPNLIFTGQVLKLSDAQLENIGYTEKQIKAIRDLAKEAEKTGTPMNELVEKMGRPSGRTLLIDALTNSYKALVEVFKTVKKAWQEIFPPKSTEEKAEGLYKLIERFHAFSQKLKMSDETADKLKRTFKGLFAALDLILTILGAPFKLAFNVLSQVLGIFGYSILDVTALIGDAIVGVRDWVKSTLDLTGLFEKIGPPIKNAAKALKEWVKGLSETDNIGKYIIEGLFNGLKNGISVIWDIVVALGTTILDTIKNILGIHSPSTEFFEIGKNIIQGLFNGISEGLGILWELLKTIALKAIDIVKQIDLGTILAGGLSTGTGILLGKALNVVGKFAKPFAELGNLFNDAGDALDRISKGFKSLLKAKAFEARAEAIKGLAIGIAVLAAAVYLLSTVESAYLWEAVGAIAVLAVIVGGLALAISKLGKIEKIGMTAITILSIAIAISIIAGALRKLAEIETDSVLGVIGMLGAIILGLVAVIASIALIPKGKGPKTLKAVGNMLLKMSLAFLVISWAIKSIAKMEESDLKQGLLVVGLVGLLFTALIILSKTAGQYGVKAGGMILKMSLAFLLLMAVIKIAAKLDPEEVLSGILVLSLVSILFGILVKVTKNAGENAVKAGGSLILMSLAMLVLVGVIKLVANMSPEDIEKGLEVIVVIGLIFTALIAVSKLAGEHAVKAGALLLMMSGALLILSAVISVLSFLDPKGLARAVGAVTVISVCFMLLIFITKFANDSAGIKGVLMTLTIAVGLIAVALVALSFLDSTKLAIATASLTAVIGVFALLIFVTKYLQTSKKAFQRSLVTIVVLTLVVAALGAVVYGLSTIKNPTSAIIAASALSLLVLAMAGAIAILSTSKSMTAKKLGKVVAMLGILTAVIAALALVLVMMSTLKATNVLTNTVALSVLLTALVGAIAILSVSKSMTAKKLGTTLIALGALTGIMLALGLILAVMSNLGVTNAITNTMALSILLGVLVGVAALMSLLGNKTSTILLGSIALVALAGVMATLGLILSMMTAFGVQDAITNTIAISSLMTVLVGVASILALIGGRVKNILLGSVGLLALAGVMAVLGLILAMMTALNVQNAIENALALSILLGTLAAVCVVVGLVGPLASAGVGALYSLLGFMLVVGALALAIGALMTAFPALQSFLDTGIPVLIQLAGGVGEMIGAFVGGIAEQLAASLPSIGESLSLFMENAKGFIEGAKQVDGAVLEGVSILALAVLELTAASLIEGIASFLSFGSSFSSLGTELSLFMNNAKDFIEGAKTVDASVMQGVEMLTNSVLSLSKANLTDAIASWFGGENSLATFGAQLGKLGNDLSLFVTNLGTFSDDQVKTVECASKAITALGSAAEATPNTGGLWQAIVGESGLSKLSGELPTLGSNLKTFITNLGTFESSQLDTVEIAGEAIVALAEAAKATPNTGGLWQAIAGESGLASLSGQLPTLGSNLNKFIGNLGTFEDSQLTTVKVAGEAIVALADAAASTPKTGGFWQDLFGESGLAALSGQLPKLGTNMKSFVSKLGTFTEGQVTAVKNMCNIINALATIEDADNIDTNLEDIGESMNEFAPQVHTFVLTFNMIKSSDLTSAQSKINAIATLVTRAAAINTEALKKLGEAMEDFADTGVKGFIDSFKTDATNSQIKKAAQNLVEKFTKALTNKTKEIKETLKSMGTNAAGELNSKTMKSKFSTAGKDVATGFANGIKNNKKLATDAGSALGKAALAAAKAALDENSPSKEMYEIGDFAGIGFVNALYDNVRYADRAGGDLADASIDGLNNAVSKISDIINSDIDSQPTIRPVLDLSNVKTGASAIGSMLSGSKTISVNTQTAGAISASMLGYQNGGNSDEVVSAIKGLRKDIAEMPRNTYNVNGVTYDDGSSISAAVQSLVRAAIVERRS